MPDKRAWLRSQGFTVGERGRFSHEMQCALADAAVKQGIKFDTPTSRTINTRNGTVTIERKRRNNTTRPTVTPQPEIGWVFSDEIRRRDLPKGWVVKFTNGVTRLWTECYKCHYSIAYCQCQRPTMHPDWPADTVTLDVLT
jgi:hypothetical protein